MRQWDPDLQGCGGGPRRVRTGNAATLRDSPRPPRDPPGPPATPRDLARPLCDLLSPSLVGGPATSRDPCATGNMCVYPDQGGDSCDPTRVPATCRDFPATLQRFRVRV